MTEDVKPANAGTAIPGEENLSNDRPADRQPDAIEQRALEMGWRPKEEFDGDEADFIDAKEFVRRKPLFDKIEHQSKEIKNVRKALEAMSQHYTKVQEAEYKRALAQLEAKRAEAVSDADGDAFKQIDTEIKRVEKEAASIKVAQVEEVPEVPQEFQNWTSRNKWYEDVSYMRAFADDLGVKLHKQGLSPKEVLVKVEQAVKAEFPNKFKNPNKENAPDVSNGDARGTSRSRSNDVEMTDMERRIMNTLVGSGQITKDKYIADLKLVKGIK
jgi:hypothetical protein